MKAIIILTTLLGAYCFAGDSVNKDDQFFVRPVDPKIDASKLSSKNVTILPAYDQSSYKSSLPSPEFRNKIFTESNLWEQVKDWDDFELDSLYIKLERGGDKAVSNVLSKYPKLNPNALERAQHLIISSGEK